MKVRLFALRDGTLDHFEIEEVEGSSEDPPQTFTWGGRLWRRFYEFGRPEPLSYLDVVANRKAVAQLLARMIDGR